MQRRTEQEVDREARRVLRKMAARRNSLFARPDGSFAVATAPRNVAASRVAIAGDLVDAFAQTGWIVPDGPGRFVLAEQGRMFLIRAFGGEDRFSEQHRQMEVRTIGAAEMARVVKINVVESPLARLKFKGLISDVQFEAGEKMRRDFTMAQMTPHMGVDFTRERVDGSGRAGGNEISDNAMAARTRLNKALTAVGPGLSDLVFDVCCHLSTLQDAESKRDWPPRSARVVLKIALDRLAAHYGLSTPPKQKGKMRAWQMEQDNE